MVVALMARTGRVVRRNPGPTAGLHGDVVERMGEGMMESERPRGASIRRKVRIEDAYCRVSVHSALELGCLDLKRGIFPVIVARCIYIHTIPRRFSRGVLTCLYR